MAQRATARRAAAKAKRGKSFKSPTPSGGGNRAGRRAAGKVRTVGASWSPTKSSMGRKANPGGSS